MTPVRLTLIALMIALAFGLLACGGGGAESPEVDEQTLPDPSPTPTLIPEERVNNPPGTVDNPFLMVLRPATWIDEGIPVMLAALGVAPDDIEPTDDLRDDLGLRTDLSDLDFALNVAFGVGIRDHEIDQLETVADLTAWTRDRVAGEVTRAIFERTSLFVELRFIESYGQALTMLCNSDGGLVSMTWLDGATYIAAEASACGQPGLRVLIGDESPDLFAGLVIDLPDPEATPEPGAEGEPDDSPAEAEAVNVGQLQSGTAGVLMLNRGLGATNPNVLETRAFCRLSLTDFYSWFVPFVIFSRENVQPTEIIELDSVAAMISAVADGTCAGAGFSADQLRAFEDTPAYADLRVSRTTTPFPYAVLTYPLEVEIGVRLSLNENLIELAAHPVDGRYLRLLLGQDAFEIAEESDFAALAAFFTDAGYDFAQLGN